MDVFASSSFIVASLVLVTGCTKSTAYTYAPVKPSEAKRVLVVMNLDSPDSKEIASYYVKKRGIPADHVVSVHIEPVEEVPTASFQLHVADHVKEQIDKIGGRIDFIVTTKGVPIRLKEGGYSLDAWLMAIKKPELLPIQKLDQKQIETCLSPYFMKNEPFNSAKFGLYLVTRLDGYDVAACKRLVDNSIAAKPEPGPFYFKTAEERNGPGFLPTQQRLIKANDILTQKKFVSTLDSSNIFSAPADPLAGYGSWGSNDHTYKVDAYKRIRFKPGAIAETFVSTSGRTFLRNQPPGQSLIADLIDQGVTGIKGYVSEPYTFALAWVDILFDRYTSGFNLAESFYMASPILKWKDVVIGDPLCNPYSSRSTPKTK